MVKNSVWSIKHDACIEDGIIYFREGIAPETLSMLVEHEATHAMKRANFSPYMNFLARMPDILNIGTKAYNLLMDKVAEHRKIDVGNIDDNGYIVLHDELCATAYATYYADQL